MQLSSFFGLALAAAIFGSISAGKLGTKENEPATVHYHLWYMPELGDNSDSHQLRQIEAIRNNTFFQVMELAAAEYPEDYAFEFITYPFGNYITSIGGHAEDPDKDIYWMIYKLPENPEIGIQPSDDHLSPVGVDAIPVEHDDIYLFWRREVQFKDLIPNHGA